MANSNARQRLEGAQAGQSLAELAVVLVLLLFLTFGIIDAGRLIFAYNMVSSSARDGVRWAVVRGSASGQVATADDIKTFVFGEFLKLIKTRQRVGREIHQLDTIGLKELAHARVGLIAAQSRAILPVFWGISGSTSATLKSMSVADAITQILIEAAVRRTRKTFDTK